MAEKNYSAFEGLNLNETRSKNETREQYKERLKTNKKILKLYSTVGRDAFQEMFPNGVGEALASINEKLNKKLGEAK